MAALTYLLFTSAQDTVVRVAALAAGAYFFVVGILLWLNSRFALRAYVLAGLVVVSWAVFRAVSSGLTTNRFGMVLGGLLMLFSYSSLAEILEEQKP